MSYSVSGGDPFQDIENNSASSFGNHSGGMEGGGRGTGMHKGPGPQGSTPPPTGTPDPGVDPTSNPGFFDQPVNSYSPNPEPVENTIMRDLLTRKMIGLEGDPFGGHTMKTGMDDAPALQGFHGAFDSYFKGNEAKGGPFTSFDPNQGGKGTPDSGPSRGLPRTVFRGSPTNGPVTRPPISGSDNSEGPGGIDGHRDDPSFFGRMNIARPDSSNIDRLLAVLARSSSRGRANRAMDTGASMDGVSYDSDSMPWLNTYNGAYSAPLNDTQNNAISGIENFRNGGGGGGGGGDFNMSGGGGQRNQETRFKYDPTDFSQIQDSGQTIKDLNDAKNLKEMQSRAAAGGNALSGALLSAEGDYGRGSDADFQNTMGQLRFGDLSNQRSLNNALNQTRIGANAQMESSRMSAGAQTAAARMSAGVANRGLDLESLRDQFAMGNRGQDSANAELAGQYGEFNRQANAYRDAYQYPDQLGSNIMSHGYPGSHENSFGGSGSDALQAFLAQQGGEGGTDWASLLGNMFGGGDSSSGDGVGYDGPTDYRDSAGYLSALDRGQANQRANQAKLGKASGGKKAMTILAMLAQILGMGKGGKKGGSKGAGGGGGDKQPSGGAPKDMTNAQGKEWNKLFNPDGSPKEKAPEVDPIAAAAEAEASKPIEKIGSTPENPLSGGGTKSFSDLTNETPALDQTVPDQNNSDNPFSDNSSNQDLFHDSEGNPLGGDSGGGDPFAGSDNSDTGNAGPGSDGNGGDSLGIGTDNYVPSFGDSGGDSGGLSDFGDFGGGGGGGGDEVDFDGIYARLSQWGW